MRDRRANFGVVTATVSRHTHLRLPTPGPEVLDAAGVAVGVLLAPPLERLTGLACVRSLT